MKPSEYLQDFSSLPLAQEAFWSDWPETLPDEDIDAALHWSKENGRQKALFAWPDPEYR